MVVIVTALFTSCEKTPPTAAFTVSPEAPQQYDVVAFTNTSTDAESYLWEVGESTYTDEDINLKFLSVGNITVKLTATNEDGSTTTEQTVEVSEPDSHYTFGDTIYSVSSDMFWHQSGMGGGDPYLRLLTDVEGQDNPDLLKLYPNKGLGELPGTYSWEADGDAGTYDVGYTANYEGMTYEWTAIGKDGTGDLTIEEVVDGVYKITGEMVLSIGNYNWDTGEFVESSTDNLTINYVGPITPLAK